MNCNFGHLDSLTEAFSSMQLICLEQKEKEGKMDYRKLFNELKELSEYSLSHSDILYSAKGLKMITLARFFRLYPRFETTRWRVEKVGILRNSEKSDDLGLLTISKASS